VKNAENKDEARLVWLASAPSNADTMSAAVSALVNEPVLWHISDPISGAMIEFGERVPLKKPVNNSTLSEDQRRYEGQKSLFIQCGWVIGGPGDLLPVGSPATVEEKWNQEMDLFVGATVVRARFSRATLKLLLDFSNEMALEISSSAGDTTAYTVRLDHVYISVTGDGEYDVEHDDTD
jgi:hypothetical protein